ncbi:MAG: isoaspartyl peptidase/L-asparaginase family protein [Chitinophagaceae bacterium]
MIHRRKFLELSSLGLTSLSLTSFKSKKSIFRKPLVISTWNVGINANQAAWKVLRGGGRALDAVEQGVMVTEAEQSCCVGLGAYPDRDGFVTLDASIMDENGNCGAVCFLERIKHPISVARLVMEKTPHVLLAGIGAQQFAQEQGFPLEPQNLSDDAKKAYEDWLKKSQYKPVINIENSKGQNAFAPSIINGEWNHDTIGMIALDANGNLSGSCTTSGMAFKMRGRVGDSPIIGAGLYVDNEIGAAVSTGVGEEVIKICGTHSVIEFMRQGLHPEDACKKAVEKVIKRNKNNDALKDIQVAFIAINKQGEYGGYSIQKGFNYAVCYSDEYNQLINSKNVL